MSVLAAAADTAVQLGNGEAVVFWILGPIALAGALGMVFSRNAVHSALFLVNTMLSLGVFYVVQQAPFLGAVQIIVYTGAIMILFLFVLMLVGRDASDSLLETLRGQRTAAVLFGLGFAGLLGTALWKATHDVSAKGLAAANKEGNVQAIARSLFTNYVFAFEVTSALLITAAVGAMVLAYVQRDRRLTQKELMKHRLRTGAIGPKPGPGVYAIGDAVDRPALLPDGTTAESSVPPAIEPVALTAPRREGGTR
jgi:NADH-quinone oxidoreductase subunit J